MSRKILVPVRTDNSIENVLAHAAAIAHRFVGHIEVLHCRPRPEDLLSFGITIPRGMRDQIISQAADVADAEEHRVREAFRSLLPSLGLTEGLDLDREHPTVSWLEAQGKAIDVLKAYGRLADLIVFEQPAREDNIGSNTLRSAVFETGRPVLMCPKRSDHPRQLGGKVALGWSGSIESARAVALTLPHLMAADNVTAITVGGGEVHGASAEDLIDYLAVSGVEATLERLPATKQIGDALLGAAAAAGAEYLIMGAYHHSRQRDTLFGGTTQHVVNTADIPVMFVH